MNKYIPRSWLYVPGTRPDRFPKAMSSGVEGVILDLEDSVGLTDKTLARTTVLNWLFEAKESPVKIAVRVNSVDCVQGMEDVLDLAKLTSSLYALVIPKTEEANTLRLLSSLLASAGSLAKLFALIESAKGINAAESLAACDLRVAGLMFGGADYAADLGQDAYQFSAHTARARLVNSAAAGKIVAIDTPTFNISPDEALNRDCSDSLALGFYGKAAIHPNQVSTINAAFQPSAAQILDAEKILNSLSGGVLSLNGKMIDAAMVRWAQRIVGLPTH